MSNKMQLATLCYVKDKGKTLMLHRVTKKNDIHMQKWNGLGGKFEPGETPEVCVKREVYEESGLTISSPSLKGFLTFPRFSKGMDWYVFVFTATRFAGRITPSPEGHLEWIDDECIPNLNLWEGDLIFLNWVNGNQFFSGRFVYEDKKLIHHDVVFH